MIILDTNVISELMYPVPEPAVLRWLNAQPAESIWTTAISIFEIKHGLEMLPAGKRRLTLTQDFERSVQGDWAGRVLEFDVAAAQQAAVISARLRASGQPSDIRDVFIAGIVAARQGVLVTRNTRHFVHTGVPLTNPWEFSS